MKRAKMWLDKTALLALAQGISRFPGSPQDRCAIPQIFHHFRTIKPAKKLVACHGRCGR